MVNLVFSPYWSPTWFAGIDLVIETLCMVVAFIIMLYGYKIFKIIKEKKFLYFSLAFFFISGAFFVRVSAYALNYFIYEPASVYYAQDVVREIARVSIMRTLGTLIPIVLMLAAFMVLIVITSKTKDKKLISLLFILSFLSSFLGAFMHQYFYYLVSFILLVYITHYFYINYKTKKSLNSLVVFISFILFTLSQLMFIIAAFHKICYVIAEGLQLVSFVMLLIGFILVFRK